MGVMMDIMKRFTKGRVTIELIDLGDEEWCVRKITKRILLGEKIEFIILNRNGMDFTYDSLGHDVTMGTKERCELVFSANCVIMGDTDK